MLSRFSSLFVYVVAGLVISAAATPMGPPGDYGNGPKSPSLPGPPYPSPPPPPKYPGNKPGDNAKSYGDGKDKPYGDGKDKSYGDGQNQTYGDDGDKSRDSSYNGQCSVGTQQCCNQFTKSDDKSAQSLLDLFGLGGVAGNIVSSATFVGTSCSPSFLSSGDACTTQQMCCEDNHFNGLIAVGCMNVNLS
ncbi:hypothetical protein BJV74DRAFT_887509 [Russula compacta]|nr:hypothetical protein BJV74DRAFT_887509 [Russula compacta]